MNCSESRGSGIGGVGSFNSNWVALGNSCWLEYFIFSLAKGFSFMGASTLITLGTGILGGLKSSGSGVGFCFFLHKTHLFFVHFVLLLNYESAGLFWSHLGAYLLYIGLFHIFQEICEVTL